MINLKKILIWFLIIAPSFYLITCCFFYFFQEKFIFIPDKLDKDYRYNFSQDFEEIYIKTKDETKLNGLLFKANNPKGLIFYLHGNAGALNSWGSLAPLYTNDLGYDLFILDYRGFGKSEGQIESETQLFEDVQAAYNSIKERYSEETELLSIYAFYLSSAPDTLYNISYYTDRIDDFIKRVNDLPKKVKWFDSIFNKIK
ncbi:MAG: alpha/beta fold hydrolase [Dysgonomonas sp.]